MASLFGQISLPLEVHREVTGAGRALPGAEEVSRANWIQVSKPPSPADPGLVQACTGLGAGESAAIFLAKSMRADLVLLDEWKARRIAKDAGLSILGCLGVLESGFRRGLVTDLRSTYVDLLRQGIRFEIKLLQESLNRFGLPPI
ncbi:MAG: DUF3368 domain-containing protein [Bryobacteraceae bacterium]